MIGICIFPKCVNCKENDLVTLLPNINQHDETKTISMNSETPNIDVNPTKRRPKCIGLIDWIFDELVLGESTESTSSPTIKSTINTTPSSSSTSTTSAGKPSQSESSSTEGASSSTESTT
ncbi:hypothetical protein L9F63_009838 [Diploptera punctata]|uniref:Uncharacterized protein n=1 Tax=Diploptera punctata TaxID=6984 RepID=A0AAD8ERN5_DIPPU|nr:hypothetical protein L9F63_009838 [Diploptera punctata]